MIADDDLVPSEWSVIDDYLLSEWIDIYTLSPYSLHLILYLLVDWLLRSLPIDPCFAHLGVTLETKYPNKMHAVAIEE